MIFHIEGVLSEQHDDSLIIDCNGVGYQVFVTDFVQSQAPAIGEKFKVFTFHHIREDAQILYGFQDTQARQLFTTLTSVSGVGPKMAMKIMSCTLSGQLIQAIVSGDLAVLTSVPGVGKKVAERLVIELKDKLPKLFVQGNYADVSVTPAKPAGIDPDLIMAMKTLGYSQAEVKNAYSKCGNNIIPEMSLEESIKVLLQKL